MYWRQNSKRLRDRDFGNVDFIEAPEVDGWGIFHHWPPIAPKFVQSGVTHDLKHPGAVSRRVIRHPARSQRPARRFLHEITGGIRIAQHGAGESE